MKKETRALVVDDCGPILTMMKTMLTEFGLPEVTTACDGFLALEYFSAALRCNEPYSHVFLDIVMPEMNGLEVLNRMRTMERNAGLTVVDRATIIVVSSLSTAKYMMDAIIEGDCTDYLVKPFEMNDLAGMLKKYNCQE